MTALQIGEFAAGVVIAFLALRDVFHTVVVPGASAGGLKIARRLVFVLRPLWLSARRNQGFPPTFGPLILVLSFAAWMSLLGIAFALVAHALSHSFAPALPTFSQAFYIVGSSLVTVGLSETDALGFARWVILGAGFCGLTVMTMSVTYLLEIQTSVADRDRFVLKLQTSAGSPPSALGLMERLAALEATAEVADILNEGRDWCATVRQSHLAHPALIYFHGKGTGPGWPATLAMLIELALIIEHELDMRDIRGRAILMREEAVRLASELVELLRIKRCDVTAEIGSLDSIRSRLDGTGLPMLQKENGRQLLEGYHRYTSEVRALARHLGEKISIILPDAAP